MMDLFAQFNADAAAYSPAWVIHWMGFMGLVLVLGLPFVLIRKEARWTYLFLFTGVAGVFTLYALYGYSRLLGLGHVIGWSPAMIYLITQRENWNIGGSWFGKWALIATLMIMTSLVFDYADVTRWLLGERG